MTYFSWNTGLSTGHALIDDDHRKMVGLINALYSAIENKQDKAPIGKVIDNLIVYYQVHFQREEQEMLRINYPGYQEHKDEHDKFVRDVHQLKQNFDKGMPISSAQVGKMLTDWLRNHIVKTDTKLAGVLNGR